MNKLQAYSCVFMLFGIIGGSILILNGDILSGIIFCGVVTLWGYLDYKYYDTGFFFITFGIVMVLGFYFVKYFLSGILLGLGVISIGIVTSICDSKTTDDYIWFLAGCGLGTIYIHNGDTFLGVIIASCLITLSIVDYKYDLKKCISNFFNDDKDVADDELYLDEK